MLKSTTPSRKYIGRIGLFFVIGVIALAAAAGTNAAGFLFMDSVKEFLGFETSSANASLNATTAAVSYPLLVTRGGSGGGTVISQPAGISCGSTCDSLFDAGTVVTLTTTSDSSSSFTGWTGACSGTGACAITMDSAKSVSAAFTLNATPTNTPTPLNPSITVIKLDDSTGAPLSGWTMNLHSGSGCTGPVLSSRVTGTGGVARFDDLSLSSYSVEEVNQPGWTPIAPVCQNVTPSSGSGGGGGGGGTVGDTTYLQGGSLTIRLGFQPAASTTVMVSSGSTTVRRIEPCAGCLPGDFDTEMLSMDMQGSSALGAIHLRESPSRPSLGQIRQQTAGIVYPADSFFDVFFEVDMPDGSTLHNEVPLHMSSVISSFPPADSLYRSPKSSSIPLLYSSGQPAGFIDFAAHVGLPESGSLVVFSNQAPIPTATNTATPTATPTNTPPSCIAPDNGSNTVDLPPPCRLFGGPLMITNGLPQGSSIEMAGSLDTFSNVIRTPGGPLGGEVDSASSSLSLRMHGIGAFPIRHTIRISNTQVEFAHGPRQTTSLTQDFESHLTRLVGQLPPGDPDFDLLRITAGSSFGLPSPGHTTLIRESPTLPRWSVDSFFDITYRIDFVGKPGGALGGMSGSTTGTIRMSFQNGPPPPSQCVVGDTGNGTVAFPAQCPYQGWPISIDSGLPPGMSLQSDALFEAFTNIVTLPGGPQGGQRKGYQYYMAQSDMAATGLSGFHRTRVEYPGASMVVDLAPHTAGQPVQSFDASIVSMVAQLPPGDPDFDLLRITAGSDFGLPSPGHTTFIRESPTLWKVHSFFDITYRVDFVGRPGGPFGGMSGSTTGTIRMQQGTPQHVLSVTKGGTGGGTVTSQPAGIDCGSACSSSYASGTVVTLTAAPSSGSSFTGWSGACTGTGACDVTMDQARSVTATFTSIPQDYTVSSNSPIPSGTYRDVTYAGCFTASLSGDITVTGVMTIAACQTLDTNGHIVFGSGSFVLGSGGALYISDPNGITKRTSSVTCPNGQCGSIQTETRIYSSSADYTYNGLTNQLVGDGLPETVHHLSVISPPSATTETRLDGYSPQVVTGSLTISGNSSSGKKEFKGHVTLLKRPGVGRPESACTEIDTYHNVVVLAGGKLTLGCDVTVTGDWTMASGGVLTGDFGVTFDGATDQTITGDTTFYKFRESPSLPSRPHTIKASGRITVTNDLYLHGDAANPLSLSRVGGGGTAGSHWELCALGTRSVDYVSVSGSDATCSGAPITATNSVNGGNNVNWNFLAPTPTATNTSTPTSTPTDTATSTSTPTPTPACSVNIPVSMPDLHAAAGSVVSVPVTTGDVSLNGVISADIDVAFNPALLSLPADATSGVYMGSVAYSNGGGRVLDAFSPSSGTLRVSLYGTQPMSGSGDIVYLTFNVIGSPGATSPLSFSLFRYNETSPCTATTSGSVTITGSVSGNVIYGNPVTGPNPRRVPNVLLTAFGNPIITSNTDSLGRYSLSGFGAGSYTIVPSKTGGTNNSISSLDAARIAQFVTGRITFTPAQVFVADVSGSSGVTSFDAAYIARFVTGLTLPSGSTGQWRFSPASRSHATVYSNIISEDYSALLMGEVSGNWGDPSPFRFALGPVNSAAIATDQPRISRNGDLTIPVTISGAEKKGIISYQFDLRYDPSVILPNANAVDLKHSVSSGFTAVVNATQPGLLRVVLYGPLEIDTDGLLLNLCFTTVGPPGAVSPLTWENVMFNEGDPQAVVIDGIVDLSTAISD